MVTAPRGAGRGTGVRRRGPCSGPSSVALAASEYSAEGAKGGRGARRGPVDQPPSGASDHCCPKPRPRSRRARRPGHVVVREEGASTRQLDRPRAPRADVGTPRGASPAPDRGARTLAAVDADHRPRPASDVHEREPARGSGRRSARSRPLSPAAPSRSSPGAQAGTGTQRRGAESQAVVRGQRSAVGRHPTSSPWTTRVLPSWQSTA